MIQDDIKDAVISDIFINDINDVPLIDVIKIDNNLWGRLDRLINKYYQGRMELLPIIMDFNNITDAVDINIGMMFKLPDLDLLFSKLAINKILDTNQIPGVCNSTNSSIVNKSKQPENTKTTAVPKLNITVQKVSYNSKSGEVIF